ncbi:Condensin-2 complex subunit D3 [Geodia barretti]|uniref:Condensin-2 complex subunit D3 n=1 Tax=Geodia barretti TaxID=519541 RepID=A0AA35STX6_GEOBA|nr:Condensin-2 complex subunit D3 [Geodia barretti]
MDLRRYVRRATELWAKQGKLGGALVRAVCSHTAHLPHQKAAWTLLAEMSQYVAPSLDTNFVYDNWKQHSSVVSMETTAPLVQILTVIGNAAKNLAKVAREDMRDEIVSMLETFKVPPVVIQAAITTLSQICESLTRSREGYQAAVDNWCVPLLKKCELYLTSLIEDNSPTSSSA